MCAMCVPKRGSDGDIQENGPVSKIASLSHFLEVGLLHPSGGGGSRLRWGLGPILDGLAGGQDHSSIPWSVRSADLRAGLRPVLDRLAGRRRCSSTRSQPARLEPYGFTHRLAPMLAARLTAARRLPPPPWPPTKKPLQPKGLQGPWRRRESNPRPRIDPARPLRA